MTTQTIDTITRALDYAAQDEEITRDAEAAAYAEIRPMWESRNREDARKAAGENKVGGILMDALTTHDERVQALARCSICTKAAIREQRLIMELAKLPTLQSGDELVLPDGERYSYTRHGWNFPEALIEAAIKGGGRIVRGGNGA